MRQTKDKISKNEKFKIEEMSKGTQIYITIQRGTENKSQE